MSKPIIFSDQEALHFHASPKPGKIEIIASKPMATQRDLSLAYSPGVAVPVLSIADNPELAYDYTLKGNLVAVISNGTAILGLGDLGALASKPVMEGKAVLFKRFADVDSIDLEVDTRDVDAFINCVALLEPSFGGINLEDIKAPECFIIESQLKERMKIPVFHDDQHGTAIIAAAGLLNALALTNRTVKDIKLVVNGAGAAAIACTELVKALGVPHDQVILCDSKGVIYQGRTDGMNQWKAAHAVNTKARTLQEAMAGADVFFGLSVKGAVSPKMVESMAARPIIFAMANPDPEITPEEVRTVRADAIIATGRSDYPNQVNNVLGFPYIFRGALDVRATTINDAMKVAATQALAELARQDVPDEVAAAYGLDHMRFGPDYIIPAPFDPRLIEWVPLAVAQAAMASGVARRPLTELEAYRTELRARLNPSNAVLNAAYDRAKKNPKRIVFAEAEEEKVLRAAIAFNNGGYGTPILVGLTERVLAGLRALGVEEVSNYDIQNARVSPLTSAMADRLYARLQRRGYLLRDCQRLVNQDRNVFASLLVETGYADGMITGSTRHFWQSLEQVQLVIDSAQEEAPFGMHIVAGRNHTVFIADTTVTERPSPHALQHIAQRSADFVRQIGLEPRVAFLSYSNFGNPPGQITETLREAVALLDQQRPNFEYEGEISPDVALNRTLKNLYPFSRLSGPANILIMPGLHAANISAKLLKEIGGGRVMGPLLIGLSKPVQIVSMSAGTSEIVNMAILTASQMVK
jgi:malate dehydrogenase (oxaloacetate-decarboxylating)(NADP+)